MNCHIHGKVSFFLKINSDLYNIIRDEAFSMKILLLKGKTMKQLLLTFFFVIMCYSLFFNNKAADRTNDEINYIQKDIFAPLLLEIASDSLNYVTFNSNNAMFSTCCVYGNISTGWTLSIQ